jgi:hypothetical protein
LFLGFTLDATCAVPLSLPHQIPSFASPGVHIYAGANLEKKVMSLKRIKIGEWQNGLTVSLVFDFS